jgi:hypothetical protein
MIPYLEIMNLSPHPFDITFPQMKQKAGETDYERYIFPSDSISAVNVTGFRTPHGKRDCHRKIITSLIV